jgi:hypothetical protein
VQTIEGACRARSGQSAPKQFGYGLSQGKRTVRCVAFHEAECVIIEGECRAHDDYDASFQF